MYFFIMYLPEGPRRPARKALDDYWRAACGRIPALAAGRPYHVRWIGLDHDSTEDVLELILAGDKTGTFTLQWIIERTDHPDPESGDPIVLIDFAGNPRVLVRLTKVYAVHFGEIAEQDIAIDGSPVRSLEIWRPLHTQYWNALLAPFDLEVTDDMPVLVEHFELLLPDTE